jgi:hypothetical protein
VKPWRLPEVKPWRLPEGDETAPAWGIYGRTVYVRA